MTWLISKKIRSIKKGRLFLKDKDTVMLDGVAITYYLSDKAVHIDNNEELKSIIKNPKTAIELARILKDRYYRRYGSELSVTELSMAIEIYGHIYPEKIAGAVKAIPIPDFIEDKLDHLMEKTDIIDLGEEGIDQNRKIWDAIAKIIPV